MRLVLIVLGFLPALYLNAQDPSLPEIKKWIRSNANDIQTHYGKAVPALEKILQAEPSNAEAWYFYGTALDRLHADDAARIPQLTLARTLAASRAFEQAIQHSKGMYSGEKLVFDPHTKLLTLWGRQALAYLYRGHKDSAYWALRQARTKGGIDAASLQYFRQLMAECSPDSYLFTNGDQYLYHLLYLQYAERYRSDLRVVDLNLLNAKWYVGWLASQKKLPPAVGADQFQHLKVRSWQPQQVELAAHDNKKLRWQVLPSLDNKLLIADQVLLEIIRQDRFEHDYYFPVDLPSEMRLSSDPFMQQQGLTYKWVPDTGRVMDAERVKANFRRFRPLPSGAIKYNPDQALVYNGYRLSLAAAAARLLREGQTAEAKRLIQMAERLYPEKVLPFSHEEMKRWYAGIKDKVL